MLQWGQDNNKDGRNPEAENASTPRQPQTEAPVQDTPSPAQQEKPAPSLADQLAAVINDVPGALNFLAYKKEIQPGQGLEAVSEKFATFILSAPDRFNTAVLQYNTPAAQ